MSLPSSFKPSAQKTRVDWQGPGEEMKSYNFTGPGLPPGLDLESDATPLDTSTPVNEPTSIPPGLATSFRPVPMGTESTPVPDQTAPAQSAAPAEDHTMGFGSAMLKAAQTGLHNFGDELGANIQSGLQAATTYPGALVDSLKARSLQPLDYAGQDADEVNRKALYENLSETAKAQKDWPFSYGIASGVASAPVSAAESMVAPEARIGLPLAQGVLSGWGGSAGQPPLDRAKHAAMSGMENLALSYVPGLKNLGAKTRASIIGGGAGFAHGLAGGSLQDAFVQGASGAVAGAATAGLTQAPINAQNKANTLVNTEESNLTTPIREQNEKAQSGYDKQLGNIRSSMADKFQSQQDQVAKGNQSAMDKTNKIKDMLASQNQSQIDTSTKESAALRKQLYDGYQKTAMRLGLTGSEISNLDPQKVLQAALEKAQASSDAKWAREIQTIMSRLHNDKAAGFELDPEAMSVEGYTLPEKADMIQGRHADLTVPRLAEVPLKPPTVLPEDVKLPLTQGDQASLGLTGRPAPTLEELNAMQAHETAQRANLGVVPPSKAPAPITKDALSSQLSDYLAHRVSLGQDVPQFQYGAEEQLSPQRLQSLTEDEANRQKSLGLLQEPTMQSTEGFRDQAVQNLKNGPGVVSSTVKGWKPALATLGTGLGLGTAVGYSTHSGPLGLLAGGIGAGFAAKNAYQGSPSAQYSFNSKLGTFAPASNVATKVAPMVVAPAITNWLSNRKKQQDLDALYGQLSAKYKVQSSSTVTSDEASDNFSKMALQGMRQSVNGAK